MHFLLPGKPLILIKKRARTNLNLASPLSVFFATKVCKDLHDMQGFNEGLRCLEKYKEYFPTIKRMVAGMLLVPTSHKLSQHGNVPHPHSPEGFGYFADSVNFVPAEKPMNQEHEYTM